MTTVICDNCGHVIHTGQPHPTLPTAMASLTDAARALGYVIESLTLTQGSARIRLANDGPALTDDAIDAIVRRAKEAKDQGVPLI